MQVITALLVVSLAVVSYASPSEFIVGGNNAALGQYPYQIALKRLNTIYCGGSIVSKRYILTAANCINGQSPGYFTVHAGTILLNQPGHIYYPEKFIAHENYQSRLQRNDIGLIRVSKDIEFNDLVQPILLVSHDNLKVGDTAVLTGWGRLGLDEGVPNNLQQINLRLISLERCAAVYRNLTSSQICTYTRFGEGPCVGDFGGPLAIKGVQRGIASYGRPCAIGYPDVFTKVDPFVDWIYQNIKE